MKENPALPKPAKTGKSNLLDFDFSASSFKLFLDLLGVFFGNTLFDRLRSGLNQILGLFQSQTGNGADFVTTESQSVTVCKITGCVPACVNTTPFQV